MVVVGSRWPYIPHHIACLVHGEAQQSLNNSFSRHKTERKIISANKKILRLSYAASFRKVPLQPYKNALGHQE